VQNIHTLNYLVRNNAADILAVVTLTNPSIEQFIDLSADEEDDDKEYICRFNQMTIHHKLGEKATADLADVTTEELCVLEECFEKNSHNTASFYDCLKKIFYCIVLHQYSDSN
jgi:hypothetical protein